VDTALRFPLLRHRAAQLAGSLEPARFASLRLGFKIGKPMAVPYQALCVSDGQFRHESFMSDRLLVGFKKAGMFRKN